MNNQENEKPNYNLVDEDVSLKEILRPLIVRRWKIVFFILLTTLCVAFYVTLLKPSYKATAILQIGNNQPTNILSINDAFNETNASIEQIKTQYELLRSRKFAERVVTRLNLIEHPEFRGNKYNDKIAYLHNRGNKENLSLSEVILSFQKRLKITPVAQTELVKITFVAYSPELAKLVANQIGATYLQYQDELHIAAKETTSQWLVDQLEELGKKLEQSELSLQDFRETEGLVGIKGVLGLIGGELTELTSAALQTKKKEDDLAITYKYIKQHKQNIKLLVQLQEVNNRSSYIQMRNTEDTLSRKKSELMKRYGPKHPKIIAIEAELAFAHTNLAEQVNILVSSLEKDYFTVVDKVKAINERLAVAKTDFLRLSRLENKFSQLQREVDTNKELYSTYLVRLKEADAMGNYNSTFYVRFIDKALAPKSQFAPNKTMIVLITSILSTIVISIIVIMRELLMDTLNSRRKLENFQDAPVLAVLPKFKSSSRDKKNDSYHVDSRFTEAVRTLRTSLLFRSDKKPPKIIAITSSVPNEGKSTVALHLSRSFSEMEKVLLIEADMRHPTLAKNLGLKLHRPGLSNLLAKTHQINECIVRDKNLRLDILTSGISPANPLAFLSMKRFNMLIKVFGNFYDRIIIETPPVNAVSDAVIISRIVDSVIYIVDGSKTHREQISSGLNMLKQVNAPIEGVVINHSQNIDTTKYHNKYYNKPTNIIKLPVRKHG